MEGASPVRLYATLLGAGLAIFGMVGFFYDSSFERPSGIGDVLGPFAVNGWANSAHMVVGALGLLVAGFASRRYALWVTALYAAVALLAAATS